MPSIDERVVAMSFENSVFEARVATTMSTLGKLDTAIKNIGQVNGLANIEAAANKVTLQAPMSALDKLRAKFSTAGSGAAEGFSEIDKAGNKVSLEGPINALDKVQSKMGQIGAGSTFTDIEKAADRTDLHGLSNALDNVANKFGVLQSAAAVALGGIASNAALKGGAFAKSFAFGPIQDGLSEYATNLNSIQTILANTQGQQVSGLGEVNSHLQELNTYSDKTIYNFSQMAKNIGTFTAAGVDLDKSTQSIKGIANLAALSGSNSEQASTAMYQLSQAIAAGKVGLQDWNSVVNAGMGGAVFQKALLRTADNMGTIEKGALKIDKATGKATINGESFRESISAKPGQKSWLTSDVLVKTLGQFTGDLSDAQLAAQGFSEEQIKAIQSTAKTAQAAATEVKTLPQVFDVARETIGSGWASTFQTIFGDFGESKKTFTELSNTINGFINTNSKARNQVLADWKKLGGRTDLIEGIKASFQAVIDVLKPIHDAFREIFPATTGKQLADMTKNFRDFAESMRLNPETANALKRTFAGLFAVLHIGVTIVGDIIKVFAHLVGAVGSGVGGILNFTGGIGDFLVALDNAISKGHALDGFFTGLQTVLQTPLAILALLAKAFFSLFDGVDNSKAKGVEDALGGVTDKLKPVKSILDGAVSAWHGFVDILGNVKDAVSPLLDNVGAALGNFGKILADGIKNTNFDLVFSAVQTTLIGGIFLAIKKALGGGASFDFGGGVLSGLTKTFGALTSNLEAMQKNIQAHTLLTIASAIGILAASILVLSRIDPKKVDQAMTSIAIGLGELVGAMALLSKATQGGGALSLGVAAVGMVALASAVLILSGAMKIMATMSWDELIRGLVGVGGALAAVGVGVKLIGPSITLVGPGIFVVAIALNVLGAAMKIFASMKWEEIAKGLAGIAGSLLAIGLGLSAIGPSIDLVAPGLLVTSVALTLLAGAVQAFASIKFSDLVKGISAIAVALGAIGLSISLIPPTVALQAAGLVILAVALTGIAGAIKILGAMDLEAIIKGITALAGVFLVLAVGLDAMATTLPGSVALLAAAAAIGILAPALALLGNLKWSTIFKGIAAIALALGTIAIVGVVAAPALVAIGLALVPLGIGFAAVAAAAYLFSKALSLLGTEGQKGVTVMVAALTGFIAIVPTIVISFLKGLVGIAGAIAQVAPQVLLALGTMIDTLIAFVTTEAPKLALAIGVLVDAIIQVLLVNAPKLIAAGIQLLGNLLDGISQNINLVTDKVSAIIEGFLAALARNLPRLLDAGVKTLQAFLNGISSKFGALAITVDTMIGRFAAAVAGHEARLVAIAGNMMLSFIGGVASYIPKLVDKGVQIVLSLVAGLGSSATKVAAKGASVIISFIQGIGSNMNKIANKGADAVIQFLNGIATTIRTKGPELRAAGFNVASALLDGIWDGIDQLGQKIVDKLGALVRLLPDKVKKLLGIKSPSTVFAEIGKFVMQGFSQGIQNNAKEVDTSSRDVGNTVIEAFRSVLKIHSPSEVMRDLGMEVGRGFAQGLKGSKDDVDNAFSSLNDKLIDTIRSTKSDIATGNKQLEDLQQQHADKLASIADLRSAKKPDSSAIASAEKEAADLQDQIDAESKSLSANETLLAKNRQVRSLLTQGMAAEKKQLEGLKTQYESITTQLDAANQALDAAIQARDQAKSSLIDKFDTTPTVDEDSTTKVADYVKALQAQITATTSYTATLAKLRAAGLDDQTYQKLLDEGLAGKSFAEQLLAGGKNAVDQVNKLDAQLLAASQQLAQNAADTLYQAGVNAAQGLVDGLTAQKAALEAQMTSLAKVMVDAIKKQLKIKSPSRVFMEVGQFTAQGVIEGLRGSSQAVATAAANLGDDAASAMVDSLSRISDAVTGVVDPDLTITPVLDLSQVQKDAQKLGDLTNVTPITAAASFGQASAASQEVSAARQAAAEAAATAAPSFSFEQNNYSPESLSDVEIYRQTKNQLGLVKRALGLPG